MEKIIKVLEWKCGKNFHEFHLSNEILRTFIFTYKKREYWLSWWYLKGDVTGASGVNISVINKTEYSKELKVFDVFGLTSKEQVEATVKNFLCLFFYNLELSAV